MSFTPLSHWSELRHRLIVSLLCFGAVFLFYFIFCQSLFSALNQLLLKYLPQAYQIITTQVTSPFTVLLKLCVSSTLFTIMPFLIYQAWRFITPGLYQKEKRLFIPVLILSMILFYLGALFAFFIVCPLALNFFYHFAPQQVTVMTDLAAYVGFISNLILIFALSFQIPLVIFLLLHFKCLSRNTLKQKRPFVIVGCFVLGMLLTPPDVISQVLLAIPLLILFELGLLLDWLVQWQRKPHSETRNISS